MVISLDFLHGPQKILVPTIIPQAIAEVIIAAIITVAVVTAWKRVETGRGEAKM